MHILKITSKTSVISSEEWLFSESRRSCRKPSRSPRLWFLCLVFHKVKVSGTCWAEPLISPSRSPDISISFVSSSFLITWPWT